jgi:hypothetical protein
LIRVAKVQPPDVPDLLRQMLKDLPDDRPATAQTNPARPSRRQ